MVLKGETVYVKKCLGCRHMTVPLIIDGIMIVTVFPMPAHCNDKLRRIAPLVGFEPRTFQLTTERANRLRHRGLCDDAVLRSFFITV